MWRKPFENMEKRTERILFVSRWLLAPFYLGLALSIVVLLIKFIEELWHIATHAFSATESEVILGVLALVDMTLTGSLLVIVMFSGYENFVSRMDHSEHRDWPSWMGTIDFTALKLKLLSSIVAISAIQLLKQFMALKTVTDRELMWYVGIHLVFVVSSVLLALSDRIAGEHGHGGANSHDARPAGHDPAASDHAAAATPQATAPSFRPGTPAPAAPAPVRSAAERAAGLADRPGH